MQVQLWYGTAALFTTLLWPLVAADATSGRRTKRASIKLRNVRGASKFEFDATSPLAAAAAAAKNAPREHKNADLASAREFHFCA